MIINFSTVRKLPENCMLKQVVVCPWPQSRWSLVLTHLTSSCTHNIIILLSVVRVFPYSRFYYTPLLPPSQPLNWVPSVSWACGMCTSTAYMHRGLCAVVSSESCIICIELCSNNWTHFKVALTSSHPLSSVSLIVLSVITWDLLYSTDSTELSIVITPSSDTVSVYSTVMLVCVAYGEPPPSITWDFEGSIITNETSYRVSSVSYIESILWQLDGGELKRSMRNPWALHPLYETLVWSYLKYIRSNWL